TVSYKWSIASLLDYDAIQQVIYMRSIVESAVLSDFIKSITPYQIEELRYRINIQRILVSNDIDIQKFFEADYEFHSIWFSHEKKELLWKIIQRSQFHYSRFRMLDLKDKDHCKDIFDEHVVLFNHIEKKEIDKVSGFINEHLQGGMHRIAERITKDYASYFL
ncbi:MAG TPA: FCD domain-containing protein, partial [Treponemataceae bacterium]|nr:FCD domain-containing protein [Treponemataceae bacterium]